MTKQQKIFILLGVAAITVLYFFVPNTNPNKKPVAATDTKATADSMFNIDNYQQEAMKSLSVARQQYLTGLKAEVKRGDVKEQSLHINHQLASFWKDSIPDPPLHFYYESEGALLENTEKSLTFAAQSILGYLPYAPDLSVQVWLANRGKQLFDKALEQNPANDSSTVGQGACIMFGADAGKDGPMSGILKVRGVVEKDSTNLFAQYMLGLGGLQSRQYDKAIIRFEKVAAGEPSNIEVLFKLAETNELMGNKAKAAEWYGIILKKVEVPEMKKELQKRIDALKSDK